MEIISIFFFLLGAVFTGNILGDMRKKLGQVVFFVWKGIQVGRQHVLVRDAKSDAQLAQRLFFKQVFLLGQDLNNSFIVPFWKHLAIKKTELNAFMSYNLLNMASGQDYPNLSYSRGSLFPTASETATYNTATGEVIVTFPTTLQGDQSLTDIPYLVIVDKSSGALYANILADNTRNDGTISKTIISGKAATDILTYLTFSNVEIGGEGFICSNSFYKACSAP